MRKKTSQNEIPTERNPNRTKSRQNENPSERIFKILRIIVIQFYSQINHQKHGDQKDVYDLI